MAFIKGFGKKEAAKGEAKKPLAVKVAGEAKKKGLPAGTLAKIKGLAPKKG